MLLGLRLKNIALVESLELTFDHGFTVLTGETGAGKSIILDALDALFGGSQFTSGARLLRSGSTRAQVEANFLITPKVKSWLNSNDLLDEDSEVFVSRDWHLKDGRLTSRSRINGVVVNREQILSIRPFLIDLTIQGQTQHLASPDQQLSWLDRLGGSSMDSTLSLVEKSWDLWNDSFLEYQKAISESERLKQKSQDLKLIYNDLSLASLEDAFEDIKLKNEEDKLVHGVRLNQGAGFLFNHLKEGESAIPSVLERLGDCIHELKLMVQMDKSLSSLFDSSLEIYASLQDLVNNLEQYCFSLESDSASLADVQERITFLKNIQRKHNLDIPGLIKLRDQIGKTLQDETTDSFMDELKDKERLFREERDKNNQILSEMRKNVACSLQQNFLKYLSSMGLPNACFEIQFTTSTPRLKGSDTVEFLFSANPGEPLALLRDVASGGEMSRVLLAFKAILAEVNTSSTLFFDEIDVGVSGKVSTAIANVLKDLSIHRQVFCITHQPLVAAAANNHFSVSKSIDQGITSSRVSLLPNMEARKQALAQLAGGKRAEAEIYAASLLDHHAA